MKIEKSSSESGNRTQDPTITCHVLLPTESGNRTQDPTITCHVLLPHMTCNRGVPGSIPGFGT